MPEIYIEQKGEMDRMVSSAFLAKLNDSCKNLIIMKLKYVDLSVISVNDLSQYLKELYLMRCEIPIDWFSKNMFNNLETLDLSESSRVCVKHLKDLATNNCKKTLKHLILSQCYRIDDKAIEFVTTEFLDLTCLKVDGTVISDLSIHWICNRLKYLNELNIQNCKFLKNPDIEFIEESHKHNDFKLVYKNKEQL